MRAGTILLYNCSGPEYSKLRQIFAMLRLRMRAVTAEQYNITLGELAEGKGEAAEQAGEAIEETVLVFCGLSQALLTQVLEVIRVAKIPPVQLKAVLTDTNREWNSYQLLEELRREKEELEKGQN